VLPGERRCSLWGNVEASIKSSVFSGERRYSPWGNVEARVKDLLADERVQAS